MKGRHEETIRLWSKGFMEQMGFVVKIEGVWVVRVKTPMR